MVFTYLNEKVFFTRNDRDVIWLNDLESQFLDSLHDSCGNVFLVLFVFNEVLKVYIETGLLKTGKSGLGKNMLFGVRWN